MRIYFNNEIEDVSVDDEVSTTTSTFDYDNVAGTFSSDLNAYADVDVEYHHSDYSEYDPRTCRDGGNYGYDYYIVTEIHEVGELQMSYVLFKNIKDIEGFLSDVQYDAEGRNRTSELIFRTFVASFNKIAELVQYNRRLPFFDLKENWALIKTNNFEQALTNLKQWVQMTDDRYDGKEWNE